ncbi:MAG: carbon-nitrogen hydrolase family protein [Rhizobiales bacterium]|nr:carbon-nitrogen hydrolase family protein [Hyphomicrobiales bacterium]
MAQQVKSRVACIQTCSGLRPAANIDDAEGLIRRAVADGATLVATPEMTNVIESKRDRLLGKVGQQLDDPSVKRLAELAGELNITLLVGSLALRDGDDKLVNRSLLFAPDGTLVAHYDKVHMFDVELEGGERYHESRSYQAGTRAVIADAREGRIGMTICYDMRFAALYRILAQAGAEIITIPSAFTRPTGKAHWEVLLRARAIETGCYVLAPAQSGVHESGRKTYGHSMIVAPWGEVVGEMGEDTGILVADIDLDEVKAARRKVPALEHDRAFAGPGRSEFIRVAS